MAKDERNTYTIQNDASLGEVKIADEVVAIIAALAATEVDGVASMAGNITNELISRLGMKNLSKGVKVDVLEGVVTVSLALNRSGRCQYQGCRSRDGETGVILSLRTVARRMTGVV